MNLFFDLDGTLLDAKLRVHQLFQKLVTQSSLTYEEYWDLKMRQIGHEAILRNDFKYSDDSIASFQMEWHDAIELPEWLALDKPFDGVTALLKTLQPNHRLYIVTARQSRQRTLAQVKSLGIHPFFTDVLVTENAKEKYELISETVKTTADDWIVGDTGKDIQVGKMLGFNTAGVLSGFRNKEALLKYQPDIIVENVTALTELWNK